MRRQNKPKFEQQFENRILRETTELINSIKEQNKLCGFLKESSISKMQKFNKSEY